MGPGTPTSRPTALAAQGPTALWSCQRLCSPPESWYYCNFQVLETSSFICPCLTPFPTCWEQIVGLLNMNAVQDCLWPGISDFSLSCPPSSSQALLPGHCLWPVITGYLVLPASADNGSGLKSQMRLAPRRHCSLAIAEAINTISAFSGYLSSPGMQFQPCSLF